MSCSCSSSCSKETLLRPRSKNRPKTTIKGKTHFSARSPDRAFEHEHEDDDEDDWEGGEENQGATGKRTEG